MLYQPFATADLEITDAVDGVLEAAVNPAAVRPRRDRQEPALTSEIVGAVRDRVRGMELEGVRWDAHSLSDRGRGAQEARYGADLIGVVSFELRDLNVSKGFLMQAKRGSRPLAVDEDLREQCEKMLRLTPASFVWLYEPPHLHVYPAVSVRAVTGDVDDFPAWNHRRFFSEFLACFVGDRALAGTAEEDLARLSDLANAREALLLRARDEVVAGDA